MTIGNSENTTINWAGRSAIWAFTLGGVGFLSGFMGPVIFNPSANQGPLLGIFITGPVAFVVGGLFGAISAFNKLSTRHNLYALILCSVFITGITINVSLLEPRYLGFVVDAEIRDCKFAESAVDGAIARWDKTNWPESYQPRSNWKADVPNMLKKDKGVILNLFVFRKRKFYENQKPWNKGQRVATDWHDENNLTSYYARFTGASCADYTDRTRKLYFPSWEASSISPPDILPTFLGFYVLESVPEQYKQLIK
jgi:Ni/Co efflux regulator RcnB